MHPQVSRTFEQFRRSYPRLQQYFSEVYRSCRQCGYIETLAGRRRYLPEIRSDNPRKAAAARRQAINSMIQGSAADLIKQAMLKIDERLTPTDGHALHRPECGRLLLQIHDELVFEVEQSHAAHLRNYVRDAMQEANCLNGKPLRVPLLVHMKCGPSWGSLSPFGKVDAPTLP